MMDLTGGLFLVGFIVIIIIYIKDIRNLIIPTRKKVAEIVLVIIGTILLLGITYVYGKTLLHIIVGILGAVSLILSFARQGITDKGFRGIQGLGCYGNWNELKAVHISVKRDVRVSFIHRNFKEDIHYYRKEDYVKIITLVYKHLPHEIFRIE